MKHFSSMGYAINHCKKEPEKRVVKASVLVSGFVCL